jgi:uncharacterized protein
MVEINVSQLLKSTIGTIRTYEVDDRVQIGDERPLVQGTVTLLRTNRGILVTGRLRVSLQLTCSRCLNQFEHSVALKLEEEFFPTIDVLTGVAVGIPEDEPGAFTVDESNVLDLSEAIRQYAMMAVPMKPLCREDCPGLCPTCGANLKDGKCDCPPRIDPRWSRLLANNPDK